MNKDFNEMIDLMNDLIEKYEKEFNLPNNFLKNLLNEDDWSFTIKIHALIEAAISKMLATVLDPKLLPIFQRLELGNKQIGKIKFAETLGLINKKESNFIQIISQLRNNLAHDIINVDFKYEDYILKLDHNQKQQFINSLINLFILDSEENKKKWQNNAIDSPKFTIWLNSLRILFSTSIHSLKAKLDKDLLQLAVDKFNLDHNEIDN